MGLDITAYRQVAIAPVVEVYEDGSPVDWQNFRRAWVNPDFPGRADEIEHGAIYSFKEKFRFRAGGYGCYGQWREELARLAGYPLTAYREGHHVEHLHAAACWNGATGPFFELICFADNQGVLGTAVSAKLAGDFAEFEAAASTRSGDFFESYLEWKKAFEIAADGGMVDFH